MNGAKFSDADLRRSSFFKVSASGCDFRGANLSAIDFSYAVLTKSFFRDAILMATDLRGSTMQDAMEITSRQLDQALTARTTILPNGAAGPFVRFFWEEASFHSLRRHPILILLEPSASTVPCQDKKNCRDVQPQPKALRRRNAESIRVDPRQGGWRQCAGG